MPVHVAVAGGTVAEVLLDFPAYRRVVYVLYVEKQLAESPCCAYHSLFYVEPALAVLQGIGIDGKARHPVGRQMLTGKIVHASGLVRTVFVEAEVPCGWGGSERLYVFYVFSIILSVPIFVKIISSIVSFESCMNISEKEEVLFLIWLLYFVYHAVPITSVEIMAIHLYFFIF